MTSGAAWPKTKSEIRRPNLRKAKATVVTASSGWTEEDDKFLAIIWGEDKDVTKKLPDTLDRSHEEIADRAKELGLKRPDEDVE